MRVRTTRTRVTMSAAQRSILVYSVVAIGSASLVSAGLWLTGVDPQGGVAGVVILAAMWTPCLAAVVASRVADGGWKSPFGLRRWGRPRGMVLWLPLVLPLAVFGVTYAGAYWFDYVEWNPGGGKWDSPGRVALNLTLRLVFGALFGTLAAMGEELGWRGYLQPRLDELGVRRSLLLVIGVEIVWHIPIFLAVGFVVGESFALTIVLFAVLKLALTPLWTWGTYRTGSIWAAAFFHSLHNTFSQSVFPRLFDASVLDPVVGELGVVPNGLYGVLTLIGLLVISRRGGSLSGFATAAIELAREGTREQSTPDCDAALGH